MTLASLIKNVKQYKLINELIYKNQNYIENIKKIAKGKVGIIDLFEMSLKNFKENNNSHTSGELNKSTRKYVDTQQAIKLVSRALKIFEDLNRTKKEDRYIKIIQKNEFYYLY